MQVVRLLAPMLAVVVARDVVHRPGSVERDERDEVLEAIGLHLAQRIAHPGAFHLEHARRIAAAEHLVGLPVVERQGEQVGPRLLRHAFERAMEHRQRLETQEVEFHQPRKLGVLHRELGRRQVRARVPVERHEVGQRPVADNHAGRVSGRVAVEALERHGEIEQPRHLLVAGADLPELRLLLQRLREGRRMRRVERNQLRNPVDLAVRHAEHPPDVADRGARLKRSEGDDLGHPVGAVLVLDVADHLVPPVLAEIDVEVGHRHPVGVQETLEEEPETQRVEIGDGQRPGDHRTRAGTAARTHRNPLLLGPLDEVGDDQEVARITHLDDGPELELQAFAVGFRPSLPAARPSRPRHRRSPAVALPAPPPRRRSGPRPRHLPPRSRSAEGSGRTARA